jgi:phage terminase large subunit GpA-like protein
LTAGIDCQQDGFFFVIRAWAADSTSWLIRYGFLLSWSDIQNLIFQDSYQKANSDERMNLGRCAIDTGGGMDGDQSMTASAYDFLGRYTHQPIFGIKGASREMTSKMKLTIIKNFPGSKAATPGAVRLYVIDTVFFKDLFHSRFQIKEGDPGCIYLHSETGMDYASQIVSEEKRRDRYGRATWKHVRGQNHYLDAEVYCSCLVHHECYGGFQVLRAGNIRPKQQEQNRSVIPYRRKKGYERPNWLDR